MLAMVFEQTHLANDAEILYNQLIASVAIASNRYMKRLATSMPQVATISLQNLFIDFHDFCLTFRSTSGIFFLSAQHNLTFRNNWFTI